MIYNNIISRIIFLIIAVIIMLWIFWIIIWRWSVVFGISIKPKVIFLYSIIMLVIMITSVLISNLPWKGFEIIWTILLRIIYATWIIVPLLILRDIISIWYKIPAIFMLILSAIWLWFGIYKWTTIKITPLTISNNNITKNYKIVFISDIHADIIHNTRYIQSIVNHIKKIQPDFVLIWGDLMNTAESSYVDAFLPFNQLKIPIYATLWNHDHMWNSGAVLEIFKKTNIIALRNQSIEISGLQIVWIDDKSYRWDKKLTDILNDSKINNNGEFTILISHQPQKLSKLDWYPINLELAWHTHNGQFIPFTWMIGLFNDYTYWKYNYNNMTAFVSQWIGSRWAPIRIWTQSELVLIDLISKN